MRFAPPPEERKPGPAARCALALRPKLSYYAFGPSAPTGADGPDFFVRSAPPHGLNNDVPRGWEHAGEENAMSQPFRTARPLLLPLALLCCLLAASCMPLLSPSVTSPGGMSADQARADAWVQSLTGLTPLEQARRAEQAWRDESNPPPLRDRAAFLLSTRPSSQSAAAQQALAERYAAASQAERVNMERLLMADLLTADDGTLRLLASGAPGGRELAFPWSLTIWQAARRGLLADNAGMLERLSAPGVFADPSVVGLASAGGAPLAPRSGCVALALPQSGPFAAISRQISDGAAVAAQSLAGRGAPMDVRIIDSSQPDWLAQIAALPPQCVAVGGPLRAEAYAALRSRPLPGRALFAFLPQLPNPADEGNTVWRFFTSPQDQIDAVLNVAGELGVTSFGALVPDDAFGHRMSDLFLQAASRRGQPVSTATYPPADMKSWTKLAGSFVGAVAPAKGKIPQSRATFEAIFLPDSWKNMDMLISTLHYNGAHKKIMLGSALWEQSLSSARGLNPATFALTIFPGVWNARAATPAAAALRDGMAARQGQAGDWAVLGYDFVQMAAGLGLDSPQWTPAALNARLASGPVADWAGAPMQWDGLGRASRRLLLFQPGRNGMVPLDREAFRIYREGRGPLPNVPPAEAGAGGGTSAPEPDISDLLESITGHPDGSPGQAPADAPQQ